MSAAGPTTGGDFLVRLLERATDAGQGLEPRVPSIFEPAPASPALPGDAFEPRAPVPSARTEVPLASAVQPAPPLRRKMDADPIAGVEPPRLRAVAHSVAAPVEHPGREDAALRIETVRKLVTEVSPHGTWPDAPSWRHSPAIEAGPEPRPTPPSAPPSWPEPRREADAAESGVVVPRLRGAERDRLSVDPVSVARAVSSLGEAPHDRPRPEPHTVNVTIGRLEIRAAQPGRAPARAAAPSGVQPMNLADYLKENGGKR
jgi:hypothetical protein